MESLRHDKWQGTTGGTTWMQKALVFCLSWMSLSLVYAGMSLVIPFYMLFNHKGYLAQYHFFRKRIGHGRIKSFFSTYINHFSFGKIILDRFAVYGGAEFKVEIEGNHFFMDKISKPEGFIQLSSHVGNFELAGYMLKQDAKTINAIVFDGETETVMHNRKRIFNEMNIKLLVVGKEMEHVYAMNNALEQGEIISMPGDRIFGSQKVLKCRFLGSEAKFPMGPYILAASRNVPLISIFVMKESTHTYKVYVNEVTLPEGAQFRTSREKASILAQTFVGQLENIVRKYPYQWFNYYEFWND